MKDKKIIGFLAIVLLSNCSTNLSNSKSEQVGKTTVLENRNIDWEMFEPSSYLKSEIPVQGLEGLWKAFKGVYRFNEHVNAMQLTVPYIFEVKENTLRRNETSAFKNFTLKENIILINSDEGKIDTGIINKLTKTELTISWKNKSNYTRYYYTK